MSCLLSADGAGALFYFLFLANFVDGASAYFFFFVYFYFNFLFKRASESENNLVWPNECCSLIDRAREGRSPRYIVA